MIDEACDVFEAKNKTEIIFFAPTQLFTTFSEFEAKKFFFYQSRTRKKENIFNNCRFYALKNIENHLQLLNLHAKLVDPRLE
jgi:citrate lyase synthetase